MSCQKVRYLIALFINLLFITFVSKLYSRDVWAQTDSVGVAACRICRDCTDYYELTWNPSVCGEKRTQQYRRVSGPEANRERVQECWVFLKQDLLSFFMLLNLQWRNHHNTAISPRRRELLTRTQRSPHHIPWARIYKVSLNHVTYVFMGPYW